MKTTIVFLFFAAFACASEDVRPKRSLFAYPTFYSGAFYGAPVVAAAPALSPVVARASTVVGQPGFVPRYGFYDSKRNLAE
ncbi:hypothetical protein GE061_013236 [Apolygus lucorum]|uniref:Uncharacterized protein n=1 Tax=Apolygus lucorum TaxID=248454 RepID=A0A8S9XUK1_APOLU|nr:hypothetical protein GE061_013236 [Apolygus lucorum]